MTPISNQDNSEPKSGIGELSTIVPASKVDQRQNRKRRKQSSPSFTSTRHLRHRKRKFQAVDPNLQTFPTIQPKTNIHDLRDLIMYSLTGYNKEPRWCKVGNRRAIEKVIFIHARGLEEKDFGFEPNQKIELPQELSTRNVRDELKEFSDKFQRLIPLKMPGSGKAVYPLFVSLATFPLSKKERKKMFQENRNRKISLEGLCLSLSSLLTNDYPIHKDVPDATEEMVKKTDDYRSTVKVDHPGCKIFAIDCEMCLSTSGKVLTRASLTDWDGKTLIDELVKPEEEIVDYVTKYSGISEKLLENVTTRLSDIQDMIISKVSSDDILIGHSLESDLNVLKIKHPNIIDTAQCFDHPRGPPSKPSLKYLMSTYIHRTIQDKDTGHDSVEDCTSCVDLVKLKLEKGFLFGRTLTMASMFSRIATCNKMVTASDGIKIPKSSLVLDYSGPRKLGEEDERIQCHSDDDVVEKFVEKSSLHDFVYMRFEGLEFAKRWNFPKNGEAPFTSSEGQAYKEFGQRFEKVYRAIPKNSVVIVCSGNGDMGKMIELQKECKTFQEAYRNNPMIKNESKESGWTEKKSSELKKAVEEARDSFCFVTLKKEADDEDIAVVD
ncbi:hypothetical protein FOA43_001744 [Brettanomyces nanus]|uniref:Exonuclease domain-containing protein n=1 Tax=Eeniella nana TaxID=13502 RepID=A0A875S262_EENNA|nr:uncharacterized protein FOA43_001744 [Brettanomyces nanus]QPG74415.1 hypothetical protein FOA43_001744 [Brettanomyces nanus]